MSSDTTAEVYVRMNSTFEKSIATLREHYIMEIQDLRRLYLEAERKVRKLEADIKELKGEKDGIQVSL